MGNIIIKINTDNDAFGQDDYEQTKEVNRILVDAARTMDEREIISEFPLFDINGNKVGEVKIEE